MVPTPYIRELISVAATWAGCDEEEGDRSREGVRHVVVTSKSETHRHPLCGSCPLVFLFPVSYKPCLFRVTQNSKPSMKGKEENEPESGTESSGMALQFCTFQTRLLPILSQTDRGGVLRLCDLHNFT